MSDFFINIGAQLNLSAVKISPSIKNTLAALSKSASGSGVIKQKYELDFDVGSIGKVSNAANSLIEGLQKTVSKTKISPTQILDQGEITDALGQLGLVEGVLKAIKAAKVAIQTKGELIPNAKEEYGRLAILERTLQRLRTDARKGVDVQLSPDLEPVRKFDQQIISASSNVEILKKRIDQLNTDKINAAKLAGTTGSEASAARSRFQDTLRTARTRESERPKVLADIQRDIQEKEAALAAANKKIAQSRPTDKAVKIAQSKAAETGAATQIAKSEFDKAETEKNKTLEPLLAAKRAAEKALAESESRVSKEKQAKFLEKKPQQAALAPQVRDVTTAEELLKQAETEFVKISTERNRRIAQLEKASSEAAKAYEEAAKSYDAKNKGKKNLPQRSSTLAAVSEAKARAASELESAKADQTAIKEAEKAKASAQELLATAKQELEAKKKLLISAVGAASAGLAVKTSDIKAETEAVTLATKRYNEALAQAEKTVGALKNRWTEAARAEMAARSNVENLQAKQKDPNSPAYSSALKERDEAQAALNQAKARSSLIEIGGVDQQLLQARKEEKRLQGKLKGLESGKTTKPTVTVSEADISAQEAVVKKLTEEYAAQQKTLSDVAKRHDGIIDKLKQQIAAEKASEQAIKGKLDDLSKEEAASGKILAASKALEKSEKQILALEEKQKNNLSDLIQKKEAASKRLAEVKSSETSVKIAPGDVVPDTVKIPFENLKQAVDAEQRIVDENQKILAGFDGQIKAAQELLTKERELLKVAQERAKAEAKKPQTGLVAEKQQAYDAAVEQRKIAEKEFDQQSVDRKNAIEAASKRLDEARKAYADLKKRLTSEAKGKGKAKKEEIESKLFLSPESRAVTDAESAAFRASTGNGKSPEIAKKLLAAKEAESVAARELQAAKDVSGAHAESEAFTKLTAVNLQKVQNAEENLRAIEAQRADAAQKSEFAKADAVARRTNAEKVLNDTLAKRTEESKKDLRTSKDIEGVVKEITKLVFEAQSAPEASKQKLLSQAGALAAKSVARPDASDAPKIEKEISDLSEREKKLVAEQEKALAVAKQKLEIERNELKVLQQQAAEASKARSSKAEELKAQISAKQTSVTSLESKVKIAESEKSAEVSKYTEIEKLKKTVESEQKKLSTLVQTRQAAVSSSADISTQITQTREELKIATAKKETLEAESRKIGGIEAQRAKLLKLSSDQQKAEQSVVQVDKEIVETTNRLAVAQTRVVELQAEQARTADSLRGNLQKDKTLRQEVLSLVEKTVQEEAKLQRRVAKSLANVGIEAPRVDPRERTMQRLSEQGVTQEALQAPTPDLVKQIKTARQTIRGSRDEELVATLSRLDQGERQRVVEKRLNDLQRFELRSAQRLNKARSGGTGELGRPYLAPEAIARSSMSANVDELAARIGSSSGGLPNLSSLSLAESEKLLREINSLLARRKAEQEERISVEEESSRLAKIRDSIEKTVNDELKKELALRRKAGEALAEQGYQFDQLTGQARRITPTGLGPAQQVLPAEASVASANELRDVVRRRLGIAASDTTAEREVPALREIQSRARTGAGRAEEQRRVELESARNFSNREARVESFTSELETLVRRQIDLETRRASVTGTRARSAEAITADVIGRTVGRRPGEDAASTPRTIAEARDRSRTFSIAEETAATQRLTRATNIQNEALKTQNRLERQQEAVNRDRARYIDRLNNVIEQTTRALEQQIRAVNRLARSGARDALGRAIEPIQLNQQRLRETASRMVLGNQTEADLNRMSPDALRGLSEASTANFRNTQYQLRQFNDDLKAVTQGSRSGFEIIARYGETAFERLGGKIGYATEKLAAYAFGGAGLYSVINATRAAIVETALLEKEITNIEQIFDTGALGKSFEDAGKSIAELQEASSKTALISSKNTKSVILDISTVTGQSAIEIAKASKDLAAAGFGRGTPGFEETIRAVSFAQLGPSFGSLEQIIDGLIASVNQFNQSLTATPYVLGLVNEFSKAFAVEAQDLFEAVKRGGGAFSAVGGNFEEFLTLVTIAREKTREAAPVIGTFLKTVSGRLYTPQAESALKQLGIDTEKVIDPYQRLIALAEALSRQNAGPGATQILSKIVDTRSVGRLYSLIEGIQQFVKDGRVDIAELRESAVESIIRDARKRLDDIGPTLDRIRTSYFRLVEGIYNNPATKALLRIPAGIGSILSKAPEVGVGNFTVGNFANPLIQSGLAVGTISIIRGAVRAFIENGRAVTLNTQALNTLRTAIDGLRANVGAGAGAPIIAPVGGAGGAGGAGNQNRGVLSRVTGLNNPIRDILISSLIPAITNSILPYTGLQQDTQNAISSGATGGSMSYLAASVFTANPYVRIGAAVGGAALGAASSYAESRARERELAKIERETRRAQKQTEFQSFVQTGEAPPEYTRQRGKFRGGLSVVAASEEAQIFFEVIKNQEKNRRISKTELESVQRNILDIQTDEEKQRFTAATGPAVKFIAKERGVDEKAIRGGIERTGSQAREYIQQRFLRNAQSISDDTPQNRIKVIRDTARELSKDKGLFDVSGIQLEAKLIEESLAQTFLELEDGSRVALDGSIKLSNGQRLAASEFGRFNQQLLGFSTSTKDFKTQSELAGKALESLGNSLANAIKKQTLSVQGIIEDSRRVFASFENIKNLLASPFKFTPAQQIQNVPTEENAFRAAATIQSITGQRPAAPISKEISQLSKVLNGFVREFSTNVSPELQNTIIKAFSDESLKNIATTVTTGVLSEEADVRFQGENARQDFSTLAKRIEENLGVLRETGPSGKALFEILQKSGVKSALPFDVQKIAEVLQSGDINAVDTKILNIADSRNALIEQANTLINAQNEQLDQQLRAVEALLAAGQERIKSEISLSQVIADNISALNSYKVSAGFLTQPKAGEQNVAAQNRVVQTASQFVGADITGFANAINEIKNLQIEIDAFRVNSARGVETKGQSPEDISKRVLDVETLVNNLGYSVNLFGSNDLATISNIAGIRQALENEIQNFETKATLAFRALGQELDEVSRKIQSQRSVIDSVISKVFSGSGAESAAAKATLTRASQNITSIFQEIITKVPNFSQLSPSEILANPDVQRISQTRFEQLAPMDFSAIRELLNIAGDRVFTQTGVTGTQGIAALQSAFANMAANLTGLDVGLIDLQKNVNNAAAILAQAEKVNADIISARTELSNIVKNNAEVMTKEVTNLTKAIAAIPKEIRIVIGGLENVNVGFDLSNVDSSMKKIADQVLMQINERLKAAFARKNMPNPLE